MTQSFGAPTRRAFSAGLTLAGLAPGLARAQAAEQVTVTHWGVLMYGVPYGVAIEKGFYKAEGLNIDGVLTSKGGGTTMRNVMASSLPYGEVSLAAAIAAKNQGIDLRIVHGGARTAGEILWCVMPNGPIRSIKDLDGKKVAFTSPKSVTDMLLVMIQDKHKIKVEGVAAGGIGAGLTMLQQGAVVATPIMDPIWAQRQNSLRALFWVKDELPPMMQTVGVTTTEFARGNREKLRRLIAARRKGVEFAMDPKNLDETAKIMAGLYNIPEAVMKVAVSNSRDLNYWSPGALEIENMNNMVRGLQIVGELSGAMDWSTVIDQSYLA